jgi:hypothetical protein
MRHANIVKWLNYNVITIPVRPIIPSLPLAPRLRVEAVELSISTSNTINQPKHALTYTGALSSYLQIRLPVRT